jgi:DNA-binding MarR family transcriptional regulator
MSKRETVKLHSQSKERTDPDAVAVIFDEATEPWMGTFKSIAEEAGVNPSTAAAIIKRLSRDHPKLLAHIRDLKTKHFLTAIEGKLAMALDALTKEKLDEASARDLAVLTGIFLEKRQLIMGEPTQILSSAERMHMAEVLPLLLKEAERRGMDIEGDYEAVEAGAAPVLAQPVGEYDGQVDATPRRMRQQAKRMIGRDGPS